MTAVVWVSYKKPDIISRGYWDQGLLERVFDRTLWKPAEGLTFEHYDGFDELPDVDGAVVVVPAQHHHDMVKDLNKDIGRLGWCLVILTGDECSLFPSWELRHPNMKLWIMTPRPQLHNGVRARFIGEGWKYDTPDVLSSSERNGKIDWFFAGQVTHERREECERVFADYPDGLFIATPGFTQGMERTAYLDQMANAKIVLCPSGPGTPDSFRLFEALEAGAVPIAEEFTPEHWGGYWNLVFPDHPFPVVASWTHAPSYVEWILKRWPRDSNLCSSWWQQKKRQMTYDLDDDVKALTHVDDLPSTPSDKITVLMPTSPIPSHPSTQVIEETLSSVRERLPGAEILIMVDGLREEQEHRRADYEEFVRRLLYLSENVWTNVVPIVYDEHLHQGAMTRRTLEKVRTPLILFVEHDTPLLGEVPWEDLCGAVESGEANVVRFHHEAHVLQVHEYLMVGPRKPVNGVPMRKTVQWSQRPHLASTNFYRWMINTYFSDRSRTMIEDLIYGVVETHYREHKMQGWEKFKLYMYCPTGDIKRSTHIDGRGEDPKYSMDFVYDGEVPKWAPHAGVRE